MIKWNATKNTNVPNISGAYLITVETIIHDCVHRYVTSAYFNTFRGKYRWVWEDEAGTTEFRNYCVTEWESDGEYSRYAIVAWAEMPKPYEE